MNEAPLRLMVFDNSDRSTNLMKIADGLGHDEAIKALIPADSEVMEFDVPVGLTHEWFAGGALYRLMGRIDAYAGFRTWEETLAWLNNIEPDRRISQIQVWGHGSPGRVWMLEDSRLDRDSITDGPHAPALARLRERLTDDAQIWFRSCGVFAGVRGQDFAQSWSDGMGCRISAHTHIIGFWHAGARNAWPGVSPHWPLREGLDEDRRVVASVRSSINRLWFMSNEVPRDW